MTLHLIQQLLPHARSRSSVGECGVAFHNRNKICQVVLAQMQRGLSDVLFKTIIEVDTELKESPVFGQPITLYAPNSRGAQQYSAVAKELMNHD